VRWVRWWYLWFLSQKQKETTTVTSEETVYHQRVRMLAHAIETGNVTATCRVFGVSPKTFHKWRNIAAMKRPGIGDCRPRARWSTLRALPASP
jgi:hypothetical protein